MRALLAKKMKSSTTAKMQHRCREIVRVGKVVTLTVCIGRCDMPSEWGYDMKSEKVHNISSKNVWHWHFISVMHHLSHPAYPQPSNKEILFASKDCEKKLCGFYIYCTVCAASHSVFFFMSPIPPRADDSNKPCACPCSVCQLLICVSRIVVAQVEHKHSFFFSHSQITQQKLASAATLPPDVLDYIVQYLPLGDARKLLRVSRALSETVRYCWPVWRGLVESKCAFSLQAARRESQRRQELGEVVTIDWLTLYANHQRLRGGQATPFPMVRHSALQGDDSRGTLDRVASAIRGAFEASTTRVRRLVRAATRKRYHVLLTGLDAAGKSTILYLLKIEEPVTTIPIIGQFMPEKGTYKSFDFLCLDFEVHGRRRALFRHYYQGTQAQVVVVDASDRDRISDAVAECRKQCSEPQLSGVPLLVFANKQDLPGAMNVEEVASELARDGPLPTMWCVQGCVATQLKGISSGLEWITWALENPQPSDTAAHTVYVVPGLPQE